MLIIVVVWIGATLVLWKLHRRGHLSHDYHNDALALGVLALATAAFFWRLLFLPRVWMSVGGGDLASFLYPVYSFAARNLKAGDLPLWNPYLYRGAPSTADNQSSLFFPPNLAAFLLRPRLD